MYFIFHVIKLCVTVITTIVIVQNILLFGYKTDVLLCTYKSFIDQSILYIRVTLAKKFLPRGYKGFKSRAYGIPKNFNKKFSIFFCRKN